MTLREISRRAALISAALALVCISGCSRGPNELTAPLAMQLASSGIAAGVLGKPYTCAGSGISPELLWSAPPAQARSLALVVTDLDSLFGYRFVHWVAYDIPASQRELPAGFASGYGAAGGIERGSNDDGRDGYVPPCPAGGRTHRYQFVVYALDTVVNAPGLTKAALFAAIRGHVLAKGALIGLGSH
ncbi:MAG TPA: YbhB/YbcL family Raf kinase inhibitor-like protein [Steroidobacteraceae bacterium]